MLCLLMITHNSRRIEKKMARQLLWNDLLTLHVEKSGAKKWLQCFCLSENACTSHVCRFADSS